MKNITLIILSALFLVLNIINDNNIIKFWKVNATKEETGFSAQQQIFISLLGGFRRSLASILWLKSDKYHHDYLEKLGSDVKLSYTGNTNYTMTDDMPFYRIITWLDPSFVNAYSVGGWYLMNSLGKFEEGRDFLKEGIRLNPKTIILRLDLARTYFFGKKDYKNALIYLTDAEKVLDDCTDPDYDKLFTSKDLYYFKAYSFYYLHNYEKALVYFKKYLHHKPYNRERTLGIIKKIESLLETERNKND